MISSIIKQLYLGGKSLSISQEIDYWKIEGHHHWSGPDQTDLSTYKTP